ncbi:MAG: hypothetical protein ACKO2P_17345 [Planctomycetota bacterium]
MSRQNPQTTLRNRFTAWLPGQSRRNSCSVIDWTSTGVVLARLRFQQGAWQLTASDWEPWPEHFDPFINPEESARLLQDWITARPWAAPPDVISLPRQFVSLRLLSFPRVAPAELAELISLQLESRQAGPEAAQVWDFLPHPANSADIQQHVSLFSAPARICTSIRRTVELAGWKLPLLTSADLFLCSPAPENSGSRLAVQMNRSKLEVIASCEGIPAASLACGVRDDGDSPHPAPVAVAALIERMIESLPPLWRQDIHAQPVFVAGSHSAFLIEQLKNAGFQTTPGPADERSPRAAAMATLLTSRTPGCNLLRPRSVTPSLYARRPAAVRSAALLAVFLLALGGWIFSERSIRHQQLQALLKKTEQLQNRISDRQAVPEQRTRLDAWLASAPDPSASLHRLLQLVPAENRVLLTRVQLENLADSSESVLTLHGLAQSPADISELNSSVLLQPRHFLLRPYGIEPAPPESALKIKFRTECVLLPPTEKTPEPQP